MTFQDLVKSHLMNAVRSEVEELKEKIIKLEEVITQLQSENEFLRSNVNRDVLLQLQQQQQQQQAALGSPPGQPALPQVPQQPSIWRGCVRRTFFCSETSPAKKIRKKKFRPGVFLSGWTGNEQSHKSEKESAAKKNRSFFLFWYEAAAAENQDYEKLQVWKKTINRNKFVRNKIFRRKSSDREVFISRGKSWRKIVLNYFKAKVFFLDKGCATGIENGAKEVDDEYLNFFSKNKTNAKIKFNFCSNPKKWKQQK